MRYNLTILSLITVIVLISRCSVLMYKDYPESSGFSAGFSVFVMAWLVALWPGGLHGRTIESVFPLQIIYKLRILLFLMFFGIQFLMITTIQSESFPLGFFVSLVYCTIFMFATLAYIATPPKSQNNHNQIANKVTLF